MSRRRGHGSVPQSGGSADIATRRGRLRSAGWRWGLLTLAALGHATPATASRPSEAVIAGGADLRHTGHNRTPRSWTLDAHGLPIPEHDRGDDGEGALSAPALRGRLLLEPVTLTLRTLRPDSVTANAWLSGELLGLGIGGLESPERREVNGRIGLNYLETDARYIGALVLGQSRTVYVRGRSLALGLAFAVQHNLRGVNLSAAMEASRLLGPTDRYGDLGELDNRGAVLGLSFGVEVPLLRFGRSSALGVYGDVSYDYYGETLAKGRKATPRAEWTRRDFSTTAGLVFFFGKSSFQR